MLGDSKVHDYDQTYPIPQHSTILLQLKYLKQLIISMVMWDNTRDDKRSNSDDIEMQNVFIIEIPNECDNIWKSLGLIWIHWYTMRIHSRAVQYPVYFLYLSEKMQGRHELKQLATFIQIYLFHKQKLHIMYHFLKFITFTFFS